MALLVAQAMGLSTIGTTRSSERATVLRDLGVADNGLRSLIDSVLLLEAAADAHRRIEAGQNLGRVVLSVSS